MELACVWLIKNTTEEPTPLPLAPAQACMPWNEIFHITPVLPLQTQASLPFSLPFFPLTQNHIGTCRNWPRGAANMPRSPSWGCPLWQRINLLKSFISPVILPTRLYYKCLVIGSLSQFIWSLFQVRHCGCLVQVIVLLLSVWKMDWVGREWSLCRDKWCSGNWTARCKRMKLDYS